jgi:hypothetical protein
MKGIFHNRKFRYIALIVLAGMPFLFMLFSVSLGLFDTIPREEIAKVRSTCSELPNPPTFTKIKDFEIVKSRTAVVSTNFASNEDPETVKDFYTSWLSSNGWTMRSEKSSGTAKLIFERDRITVEVEYEMLNLGDERQYHVSCSYGIY